MRDAATCVSYRFIPARWASFGFVLFVLAAPVTAAEEPPRAALCLPLAVPVNATTRVVLRGWALERVDEVRCEDPGVTIAVAGRGEAALPNPQDLSRIGNRQLELDVTVSADHAAGEVPLQIAVAGTAQGPPCRLMIGSPFAAQVEAEPNNGFRAAQAIDFQQVIDGGIQADRDVDVYALQLNEERTVRVEVRARSFGSALDGLVTIYDAQGRRVVENDDRPGQVDPQVERRLPAGRYSIVVQDALDRGGPGHVYRLLVGPAE
jgi:hypothetical protein